MFQRLWVQILAPCIGWAFFTYICCKNYNDVCLKRPKINDKRGPFKKLEMERIQVLIEAIVTVDRNDFIFNSQLYFFIVQQNRQSDRPKACWPNVWFHQRE